MDLSDPLPRAGSAVALLVVGVVAVRLLRPLLKRYLRRNHTESFATVMSKLAGFAALFAVFLGAVTLVFPSVKPVDLLAGLGFFSVAIGFAFQDILENLLAGVLLLFREPFKSGDQIEVNGLRGTVERITIRETQMKTFDGKRILIPNADVYKNAVEVQTAFDERRTTVVVGVAYEADLDEARSVIVDALEKVDGVRTDPAPQALTTELAASTVNIEARYWTDPDQASVRTIQDRAVAAIKGALDDAGIEMPCDIVALQATSSFEAAMHGTPVTPGGSVDEQAADDHAQYTRAEPLVATSNGNGSSN